MRASSLWVELVRRAVILGAAPIEPNRVECVQGSDEVGTGDAVDPAVEHDTNVLERDFARVVDEHVGTERDGRRARALVIADTVGTGREVVGDGEQHAPVIDEAVVYFTRHLGFGVELAVAGPTLDQAAHLGKDPVELVEVL
jgi:hypothetical protein